MPREVTYKGVNKQGNSYTQYSDGSYAYKNVTPSKTFRVTGVSIVQIVPINFGFQVCNIFTSFSPKFFLTIFLVKSKLSTAKKPKTTTFSRVFHPKKSTIFSGNQSWIFGQKMKISNSVIFKRPLRSNAELELIWGERRARESGEKNQREEEEDERWQYQEALLESFVKSGFQWY